MCAAALSVRECERGCETQIARHAEREKVCERDRERERTRERERKEENPITSGMGGGLMKLALLPPGGKRPR